MHVCDNIITHNVKTACMQLLHVMILYIRRAPNTARTANTQGTNTDRTDLD